MHVNRSKDGQQNIEDRGREREDDRVRNEWIVSGKIELKWTWSCQQTELDGAGGDEKTRGGGGGGGGLMMMITKIMAWIDNSCKGTYLRH